MIPTMSSRRLASLRAALAFLRLHANASELELLHSWLDTWTGLGLVVVGVERQGLMLSLTHIAEAEWRAVFMGPTPCWRQRASGWRQRRGVRCRWLRGRR